MSPLSHIDGCAMESAIVPPKKPEEGAKGHPPATSPAYISANRQHAYNSLARSGGNFLGNTHFVDTVLQRTQHLVQA
jgi:hypothetical protein